MSGIIGTTALWPAEKFINHALASDAHLRKNISPFVGKSLEIKSSKPNFSVTAFFDSGRISLSSASAEQLHISPDASISGEAVDLFSLLATNDRTPLANTRIKIAGDAQLVQDLYGTFQSLDIQWADFLAPIAGDVISNEVEQLVQDTRAWSADSNQRIRRNVNDYIVEEAKLAPHASEVEKFSQDLDALRLKIDRVNAKAELLYQRIDQLND